MRSTGRGEGVPSLARDMEAKPINAPIVSTTGHTPSNTARAQELARVLATARTWRSGDSRSPRHFPANTAPICGNG
jgi:hypothetical protein